MSELTINNDGTVTISVTISLEGNLMEMENSILDAVNDIGNQATGMALKRFDTDGSAIIKDGVKWTSRAKDPKNYQTPYGVVEVKRHVYQTSKGGRIYCPLENDARMILNATPKFAQQVSHITAPI